MCIRDSIKENEIDLMSINSRNTSGTTALHVAASNGCMKVLMHLVTEVCVDINATDNWSRTALDEAMHNDRQECIDAILKASGVEDEEHEDDIEVEGEEAEEFIVGPDDKME